MAASQAPSRLDPERDFERLRPLARRRFLARARRAGQAGRVDLDAAADDAYQEAWLELQRRPGDAAIEHDPASYLAGIMWHRFHRLELRPARVETDPLADDSPSGDDGPDAVVERRQTLAAVRDALAELPERERTAVLLRADGAGARRHRRDARRQPPDRAQAGRARPRAPDGRARGGGALRVDREHAARDRPRLAGARRPPRAAG